MRKSGWTSLLSRRVWSNGLGYSMLMADREPPGHSGGCREAAYNLELGSHISRGSRSLIRDWSLRLALMTVNVASWLFSQAHGTSC